MSLLMQALKKAERAKLNSAQDDALDKPSEAYDQVLSLAPQDGAAATPPAAKASTPLTLDTAPMEGLSLAPLDAPAPAFAAAPDGTPTPASSGAGLTLEFDHGHGAPSAPAIPVLQVALEALHDPVPAQAQAHPIDDMAGLAAAPPEFKTMAAPAPAPAPAAAAAQQAPHASHAAGATHGPDVRARAGTRAGAQAGASAGAPAGSSAGAQAGASAGAQSGASAAAQTAASAATQAAARAADKNAAGAQRGAARARAAAAAVAAGAGGGKAGIDPAKMRLMILTGIAVAIIGVFGYIYWQATNAPGAGARLPPVPMPPANATGATSALMVVANPGANAGVIGANGNSGGTGSSSGATSNGLPATGAAGGGNPAGMPEAPADAEVAPPGTLSRLEDLVRRLDQRSRDLEQRQQQLAQQAAQPPRETLTPVAAPSDASDIRVGRSAAVTQLNPDVQNAYQAYTSGDLVQARQEYDNALRNDPNNRDALLGTAAMAIRQNQPQAAAAAYLRLLELDPNDADAMAGLAGMRQVDSSQAELRLKAILKRNPDSGPLNFALGNLYARQGRWPDAQQSYFRAYSASPDNADYAFNLAVGLDRLNQPKLAVNYYQHALAATTPGGFDRTAVRKRLHELTVH